jgi:hypothetical protein
VQDTGDVLYRVSGAMMVISGLFNGLMSCLWVLSFIWVCVGVFWFIPMILALAEIVIGIVMIATGRQVKLTAFAPFLGLVASMCNMNLFGSTFDLIAIALGIGGFVVSNQAALEDHHR